MSAYGHAYTTASYFGPNKFICILYINVLLPTLRPVLNYSQTSTSDLMAKDARTVCHRFLCCGFKSYQSPNCLSSIILLITFISNILCFTENNDHFKLKYLLEG